MIIIKEGLHLNIFTKAHITCVGHEMMRGRKEKV